MADVVTKEVRSRMMSGIKGKNTKPEILIRKGLFSLGYRYRLHNSDLPGKPDIVLPKYNAVIMANGCFWHQHDCSLFKWPSTNKKFWKDKISGNKERDKRSVEQLLAAGWRVMIIWECCTKGSGKLAPETILERIREWIESDDQLFEIKETI